MVAMRSGAVCGSTWRTISRMAGTNAAGEPSVRTAKYGEECSKQPVRTRSARPEHQDVLPREDVDHALEAVALRFELHTRFADRHLVFLANRHPVIFLAELDQHQPATRLDRALQRLQERLW